MMRKLIIAAVFFALFQSRAAASAQFEAVLAQSIKEYGVYANGGEMIYAGEIDLEGPSLLTVRIKDDFFVCDVYGEYDGLQLTDTLYLRAEKNSSCALGIGKDRDREYIVYAKGSDKEYFTLEADAFKKTDASAAVKYIAESNKGVVSIEYPSGDVYGSLKKIKIKNLSSYDFIDKRNSMPAESIAKIKDTVTACADLMSFDIRDYDYDKVFKYVLYTHDNFRILTDIPDETRKSGTKDAGTVFLVNGRFIDHVMEKVLRIEPQKPPVNNLLSRGFCYNNGVYLYRGGFNVFFSTEVEELLRVYDLGSGVLYVVFSDIYRENGSEVPELSFALLQSADDGYSLLRLGMGENLLSRKEAESYSSSADKAIRSWKGSVEREKKPVRKGILRIPILLVIFSVGTVGVMCGAVALVKSKG